MPKTRPFCCGGKADINMAGPVVLVKAAPPPCSKRKMISQKPVGAIIQRREEAVNSMTPSLNNRRMPVRSPQRPTGSSKTAMDSKKAVTTQLRVTASNPKLFSMAGNAILMDEMRNVPMKDVVATMASMDRCLRVQFIKKEKMIVHCKYRNNHLFL